MNSKKKRKLIASALVAVSATLCITGSLAFFTDRADGTVFAKAGTMDMVFTDTSSSKTGSNGITSNNEFAIDGTWDNSALVSDGMIINPGDFFDVSYNLSNAGNKSMDIRQKITVTSDVPMFEEGDDEYLDFNGGFYLTNPDGSFVRVRGESTDGHIYSPTTGFYELITGIVSEDKKSITYELPDTTLSGTGEAAELEIGGDLIWDTQTVSENNIKSSDGLMVKISDLTPSKEEIIGKVISIPTFKDWVLGKSDYDETDEYLFIDEGYVTVVYQAGAVDSYGDTYPEPGIYVYDFYSDDGYNSTAFIENLGSTSLSFEQNYNYILYFDLMSGNEFQGKGVTVKLDIQAKQHHNTGEDTWVDWASYETTVEKVN